MPATLRLNRPLRTLKKSAMRGVNLDVPWVISELGSFRPPNFGSFGSYSFQILEAGRIQNSETTDGTSRFTPLIAAAAKGHSRIYSLLLEAGANVDHAGRCP